METVQLDNSLCLFEPVKMTSRSIDALIPSQCQKRDCAHAPSFVVCFHDCHGVPADLYECDVNKVNPSLCSDCVQAALLQAMMDGKKDVDDSLEAIPLDWILQTFGTMERTPSRLGELQHLELQGVQRGRYDEPSEKYRNEG